MPEIKLGLVGCGAVAERYYLPILQEHPEICKGLHLVDKNVDQAKGLAEQLDGARYTDDYNEILDKVQGVIVAVPHQLHYRISMDFLKSRCHVLCEKPLAESPEQAGEMILEAENNGVALAVNYTRRLFPSSRRIKEIIASGEIGKVSALRYIEAMAFGWPSATGFSVNPEASAKGVLLDVGPHIVDLICWWLDAKPDLLSYEDDSFGGPESVARVKARTDTCTVEVLMNRFYDLDSRFEIKGEAGSIEGAVYGWEDVVVHDRSGKRRSIKMKTKEKLYSDFVRPVFANFLEVIAGTEKPLVAGADVMTSIEFIEACYQNRSRFRLPWYENLEETLV